MSSTLVGQTLGKYKITQLVGHGGMATVYKGFQADVERNVAIKVLPPHPGQSASFVERFRQEARTIAKLQHPHILPLYDYGDQDDVVYLVMPFIEGGSLAERLRRGAMSYADIERLVSQVASALDYAHRQGVIHRDIKPDNIMLNQDGFALLTDFGIAKLVETSGMTTTGGLVGTPAYISPEQAQNLPIDGRADIYSFGTVVYEMLTGRQPFRSDAPMQLILAHITAPAPMVSEFVPSVPRGIDLVMARVLAKNPNDRYQTAGAFADDLKKALQGYDIAPPFMSDTSGRSTARIVPPLATPAPGSLTPPPPGYFASTPPPGGYGTPPPGYYVNPNAPPTPTQVPANSGVSPVILIGGFFVIALLLIAVLIVLIRNQPTAIVANLTPPPAIIAGGSGDTLIQPTRIPLNTTPAGQNAVVAIPPRLNAAGRLTYSTSRVPGDTASIVIQDLAPLDDDAHYAVWMRDNMRDHVLALGSLTVDDAGTGTLDYTAEDALAMEYHRVFVTVESGDATEPSGDLVYEGEIPVSVIDALTEILIASPDGLPVDNAAPPTATVEDHDHATSEADPYAVDPYGYDVASTAEVDSPVLGGSLLDGALTEADFASRHAGLAAGATNVGGMHTHAEHAINILRGTQDDLDGSGRGENPGRGVGVLAFLDRIDAKLTEAAADAPARVQSQIDAIRVCVSNARAWMNAIIENETQMLASDNLEAARAAMEDSTRNAQALLSGVDLNQNGEIEAFEGECGLGQIAALGVSAADMEIVLVSPS